MIADAIAHYHELLTPDVASASWSALEEATHRENLRFGDRSICTVLRPYFLSRDEHAMIAEAARLVLSATQRVFGTIDPYDYESLLGLSPDEAALARIDCGFEPVVTLGRLDGFLMRDGRFAFVEFNAESPGGIAFGQALARIFRTLPVVQKFAERYRLHSEPTLDHSLDALLGVYRRWSGSSATPNVAIVDWVDGPTHAEFEMGRKALEGRGVPARILDPTELEISGGRLRAGEFEIDLVYRRLVASEIPRKLSLDHPLVRAGRDRLACLASGFGAFALTSKIMFALLSDPAGSPTLTAEERAAVDRYVPWTRIVRDGRTTDWSGKSVDLAEFAVAHRDELVVKPATDYGGSGVYLGWVTDDDAWIRAYKDALDRPSVIQRRVALPSEPFPTMATGSLQFAEFLADIDPYCFDGRTDLGAGTRLSQSQLLNVTAGGGSAAPVFVLDPK